MTFWAVSSQVATRGDTNTNPDTKWQSAQWNTGNSHHQEIPSVQIKSHNNVADLSYSGRIVHYEFEPNGQTVIQVY